MGVYNRRTDEQIKFLRENCASTSYKKLTALFNSNFGTNKSVRSIEAICHRNGLRNGRHKYLTQEQIDFLRVNSHGITRKELTELFNKKFDTSKNVKEICYQCNNHGFLSGTNSSFFRKGNTPWFNGLSEGEIKSHFTEESYNRCVRSRRKYEINDVVKRKNGLMIVLNSKKNKKKRSEFSYSKFIYEQAYGKIPPKHVVINLDNNKENLDIDNLHCIPVRYMIFLNKNHWLTTDPELTLTAIKWCELYYALQDSREQVKAIEMKSTNDTETSKEIKNYNIPNITTQGR